MSRNLLENLTPAHWDSGKPAEGSGFPRMRWLQQLTDLLNRPVLNRLTASTNNTVVNANGTVQSTGVGTAALQPKRYAEFTVKARVSFNLTGGGNGGGGSTFNVPLTPDTPPSNPNALNDEFDTGNNINLSQWTWTNQGGASAALADGALKLVGPPGATQNNRMLTQPFSPGSSAFEIRACCQINIETLLTDTQYWNGGLIVRNTLNGLGYDFGFDRQASGVRQLSVYPMNSPTSYGAVLATQNLNPGTLLGLAWGGRLYLSLRGDGSGGLHFRYSLSGAGDVWQELTSVSIAGFMGSINFAGVYIDVELGAQQSILFHWFRRVS